MYERKKSISITNNVETAYFFSYDLCTYFVYVCNMSSVAYILIFINAMSEVSTVKSAIME